LALIVILIGVIFLVIGEVNLANSYQTQVNLQYSAWSDVCNLTNGNTYQIDISGNDWGSGFAASNFANPQPLNVTITSPGGGVTSLQAFYWGEAASGDYRGGTPPTMISVTYLNVDDSGLTVDPTSPKIVITAKQTGLYNVSVPQNGGLFYTSKQPPDFIAFYVYVIPSKETYSLLTASGGGIAALGGVTFIVSLFRKQPVKRKRTSK
jgi:hypothetical protein